jgi:hypothetical protein
MSIRTELAAALRAAIPGVAVYEYPVEVPLVPSIVIAPGDPYIEPYTYGPVPGVEWRFRLTVLEHRGEPSVSLDALEERRKQITDELRKIAGAQWTGFENIGEVTVSEIPAMGGTVQTTIRRGETTT